MRKQKYKITEEFMRNGNVGIYKITNPEGRIYIGQSRNLRHRFYNHKHKSGGECTRLSNSIIRHGFDSHKFEAIEYCRIDVLNEKEEYYVALFSSSGDNGLNCASGGVKGCELSQITKDKIRESTVGRRMTEANKLRMSLKYKGVKKDPESVMRSNINSCKIIFNTQTGVYYFGVKEAAESAGFTVPKLNNYLYGRRINKTNFIKI